MLDVIKAKRKPAEVQKDVIALKKEFSQIKYGFQNVEEAVTTSRSFKHKTGYYLPSFYSYQKFILTNCHSFNSQ